MVINTWKRKNVNAMKQVEEDYKIRINGTQTLKTIRTSEINMIILMTLH